MYELLSFTMLSVRYCANSVLFYMFTKSFFNERYGKKLTLAVWNTVYIFAQLEFYYAFNTMNVFENILDIALRIAILLLLQRLLFAVGRGISLFTVFCFIAGQELAISIVAMFIYQFLGDFLYECIRVWSEKNPEFFLEYGDMGFFLVFAFLSVIAVGSYIAILSLYLKIIKNNFRQKDYRMQLQENVFLILPSVASVCIYITVRMMEFDAELGNYAEILDELPVTKLFIPIVDILLLGTNVASVILFQNLVKYNEEKSKRDLLESQITQMQSEVKEIQDIYSDIRGLRHDMKNHINDISLYVKSMLGKEDPIIEGYIGKMTETVNRLDFSFNTGNPITDIIIHQKGQEAEKKQITFKTDFYFPQNSGVDAYDMGIILNNALGNAIEACEKVSEPYIFLRSYTKGSLFFIEVRNNFSGKLVFGKETGLPLTGKGSNSGHGFGLVNIRRTAEKYMGDIDIGIEEKGGENVFVLTVMVRV